MSLDCEAFHQETAGVIDLQQNSIYPWCFHWWVVPIGLLPTTWALWSLGRMPDPLQDVFLQGPVCKVFLEDPFWKALFGRPFLEDPFWNALFGRSFLEGPF